MVACVLEQRWSIEATADRFQVDAKTVRKWRDRFVAEGDAVLDQTFGRAIERRDPLLAGGAIPTAWREPDERQDPHFPKMLAARSCGHEHAASRVGGAAVSTAASTASGASGPTHTATMSARWSHGAS